MKKLIFTLTLALALAVPALCIAGQGSDLWYGAWFNDRQDAGIHPFQYNTWIQASNPNANTAKFKVTYYQANGAKFANTSSFSHEVAQNNRYAWRPGNDINKIPGNPAAGEVYQGSYVINVTEGSITIDESMGLILAKDDLPYLTGDVISTWAKPAHTITSTFLTFDSMMHYDADINNEMTDEFPPNCADKAGETITCINLTNPSDNFSAKATVSIYDSAGNLLAPSDTQYTNPFDLDFSPHQAITFTPGQHGINGTAGNPQKVSIVVDVKNGSLVGGFAKFYCDQVSGHIKTYRAYGSLLNKRLTVR
jgi:hypothetical protein